MNKKNVNFMFIFYLKFKTIMKKAIYLIALLILIAPYFLEAADGDRSVVRTIEFTQRRIGWFDFPANGKKYHQILMHFKLRCPPGRPCGEWDYTSNVFLNKWYAPSFRADKKVVNKFSYMNDTSWSYKQIEENGQKVVVKSPKNKIKIEFFNDSQNPTKLTDTLWVWPDYYTDYKFDASGKAIDSIYVEPDETLILSKKQVFYNDDVTFSERWELFRFITPYGNNLNLGTGVTWTMDVTDFAPLLTGKVHLASPNGGWGDPYEQVTQEDLELTFEFIEGTPPRNVINVMKLWEFYGLTYDKFFEDNVKAYDYTFAENEKTAMMRVVQTGHGFGGTADNCAEFCSKLGMAKVDGVKRYEQQVWRECGDNPVYPQGGTWIYDRSNWCPGAEVDPYDYELTPFIKPGSKHSIDYDMEYYDLQWSGGSNTKPQYILTGFLFTYSDLNFNLDARMTAVISPNSARYYNRFNPSCGNPIISVQNSGKEIIKKLKFRYGNKPDELVTAEVDLENELNFMEITEIELPNNGFYKPTAENKFLVEIIEVNGKSDDVEYNNSMTVDFDTALPEYFNEFTINLLTPNSNVLGVSSPITYKLQDINGKVLYSREATDNSKLYEDKVNLPNGCYKFTVENKLGYGLGFWAYQSAGLINGSLTFDKDGAIFKQFPTDWGNFFSHEFAISEKPAIQINLDSDTLDFGNVVLGSSKELSFEISPKNEKGLVIENLSIILGNSKKFEVTSITPPIAKYPHTLKFGEKVEVKVAFTPTGEGLKTSPLRIKSNDFLNWQKEITLSGIGRDPSSVSDNTQYPMVEVDYSYSQSANNLSIKLTTDTPGSTAELRVFNLMGDNAMSTQNFVVSDYYHELNLDLSSLPQGYYQAVLVYRNNVKTIPVIIIK